MNKSTSKTSVTRSGLLAAGIVAACAQAGCGGGAEVVSPTGSLEQAVTGYAPTVSLPSSGKWQFTLRKGTWGTGNGMSSAELATTGSISWPNLANNNFDDAADSFVLCNNTGAGQSFSIKVYRDANYTNMLQYHSAQKIPGGGCSIVNMKTADVTTSVIVSVN